MIWVYITISVQGHGPAHALLFRGSLLSQQSSVSAAKLRKHSYAAKVLMAISL